ncbi:LysR family transcriptional regulator [Vreelandella sedimenti]|uniref:LysR family transcriptional regulator n=1 Tax=Vreelandella sedimenti TaxID=2729618 RepID=UPI00257FBD94|nr:LysR family transcriptional regulator [Halomonas sp. UBA3173]|tara:strand:- start:13640 stop:14554 length:915 start_codon:yes stop_codon:yes gene_type:complete
MRSFVSQLSIHKLEVFCMVAELKSISRAAERLNIAQPVVSAHLKSLADKLGVSLTERSGRRIALTEEGERVYQWAHDVVIRTHELEREIADTQSGLAGKAKVGASMTLGSYVLPSIIASIRQRYPQGEISVQVTTPILATDAVLQGECDFAFTILDPRHEIAGLEVQRVRDEQLILVASNDYGPKKKSVSLEELAELPFVTAQLRTPRREIEEHLLMEFGVSRNQIVMEFGHAEAIKQAVRAGAGVAFLFLSSVNDELASGLLKRLDTSGMELRVPVYLVRRKNKNLAKFQSMMLDEITRALSD